MSYAMPMVEVGDTVSFSKDPSGSSGWTFAFVSEVSDGCIAVFAPQCAGNVWRDNVRHISDPVWRDDRRREHMLEDDDSGVFKVRHKDQELIDLRERLATLEQQLGVAVKEAPKAEKPKVKPKKHARSATEANSDPFQPAKYDDVPDLPEGSTVEEIEEIEV